MSIALILKRLLLFLFILFCCAYPIAVVGVAFNVQSPFSLAWAGSALLFLEGTLLIGAAMMCFGWRRGLLAGLLIIALSYLVEAIGVNTGFPFGVYHYTNVLFPLLPAHVPFAVMFAWVMVILGSYGWLYTPEHRLDIKGVLLGATLAMLLDLEIEPVAAYLEHYWQWQTPSGLAYYGVPLANFVAWFVVALLLLCMVDRVLWGVARGHNEARGHRYPIVLAILAPRILFGASLLMFGLIDLTHGYYLAVGMGLLAAAILSVLASLPKRPLLPIVPAHRVEQDQTFQSNRERM